MTVGGVNTEKLVELLTVIEFDVTAIVPLVAPVGTVAVSCTALAAVTVAALPLNLTTFAVSDVGSKFVPEIVTVLPTIPLGGENPLIVGGGSTVNVPLVACVGTF